MLTSSSFACGFYLLTYITIHSSMETVDFFVIREPVGYLSKLSGLNVRLQRGMGKVRNPRKKKMALIKVRSLTFHSHVMERPLHVKSKLF